MGDIVKTDLYALLEVDTDATDKVLLKAYRYVAWFPIFSRITGTVIFFNLSD